MRMVKSFVYGFVAVLAAAPAMAQDPPPPQPAPPAARAVTDASEPRLVFEREVFDYPGRNRRDPFMPLTGRNAGPLFTDLKLHMIIHSDDPRQSIVDVSDASKKRFRLRRGDAVGNATVVDIQPTRVVFSVVDFGIARNEVLDMKATGREPPR